MDLELVRKELRDTIELARAADQAIQIDFWRSLAIYQNGFGGSLAMNKLFKTDPEHARIKFTAFGNAAEEAFDRGDLGSALSFSMEALFTRVCSECDESMIQEVRTEIEALGVELGFPEISLGSEKRTKITRHWKRASFDGLQ